MTRASDSSPSKTFSLSLFLERWGLLIVLVASWAAWLLTVRNVHRIWVSSSVLPMVFWLWFVVFYGGIGILVLVVGLLAHRYGMDLGDLHRGLGLGVLIWIGISALLNAPVYGSVFSFGAPYPFGWLAPMSGGLLVVAMVTLVIASKNHQRWSRVAFLVGFGIFVATLFPWGKVLSSGGVGEKRSPLARAHSERSTPLVLIGVDGADWDHLKPLMEQGRVPHLRRLKERGSSGLLETLQPTKSPALWTTIATGFPPEKHGVQGFVARGIHGFPIGFPPLKPVRGVGFYTLANWIQRSVAPVSSYLRMRPAYWNIASMHREPSIVLNWWGTWPAEPIYGFMISERIHYRRYGWVQDRPRQRGMVYPARLDPLVLSEMVAPGDVTLDMARQYLPLSRPDLERMKRLDWEHHRLNREFPYIVSAFETNRRLAPGLVDLGRKRFGRTPDALVLFRATDLAMHAGLKYSTLVENHLDATADERTRYGHFVSNVYHHVDRAVGQILDRYDTANVVIVSDHGFTYERSDDEGRLRYHHKTAPDGIWIAAGPAFKKGETRRISIYDILPLVSYTKGFAVADDWTGRVPTDVFREAFRARHEVHTISSYGRRTSSRFIDAAPSVEKSIEERLRGVGYLE